MREIELCMKYANDCKLCPLNKRCEEEYQREMEVRMVDYVTCKYCGVTIRGHICPHKKSRVKSLDSESVRFRNTKAWARKSVEIKQRDRYLCAVCLANLYNTMSMLNYKAVEVHHITSIKEDYNKRLDNGNLITLCSFHHKMADKGEIPRDVLFELVKKAHEE